MFIVKINHIFLGDFFMTLIYTLCALLILGMGVLHVAITKKVYKKLSLDAMWFSAGGFTLILASFINLIYISVNNGNLLIIIFCYVANLGLILFLSLLLKVFRQPHVIFLFCLALLQLGLFVFLQLT